MGENIAVFCNACDSNQPCRKRVIVQHAGDEVIISLNRFRFDRNAGATLKVTAPIAINKQMSFDIDRQNGEEPQQVCMHA